MLVESSDSEPESSDSSESRLFRAELATALEKDDPVDAIQTPPSEAEPIEVLDGTAPDLSQSSGIVISLLEAEDLGGGGGGGGRIT